MMPHMSLCLGVCNHTPLLLASLSSPDSSFAKPFRVRLWQTPLYTPPRAVFRFSLQAADPVCPRMGTVCVCRLCAYFRT